jgi:signal transduction histidine kinase
MTGPAPDFQPYSAPALAADSELTVRGLLHDLGHQMMTLSLLADSVRDDSALSADSRQRMELVMQEMFRIVDIIADAMPTGLGLAKPGNVDVRLLASEVAQLADLSYDTTVTVAPGRPATIRIGATLLWRILANLVDNAVRAAGPGGRVEIRIEQDLDTVMEVTDNGPGFGRDASGAAGVGLTVVRQLLDAAGGRLDVTEGPHGGACVRVTFGLVREYHLASADAGPWH